jgi:hypothetical protein
MLNIIFSFYFALLWWLRSFETDHHPHHPRTGDRTLLLKQRLVRRGENPKTFIRIAGAWQRRCERMRRRRLDIVTLIRWRCACLWTLVSLALFVLGLTERESQTTLQNCLPILVIGFLQFVALECVCHLIPVFAARSDAKRGQQLLQMLFEICGRTYGHNSVELIAFGRTEVRTGEDQQKLALNWIKERFAEECLKYQEQIRKWSDIRTIIELMLCGAPCLSVLFTA